MPDNPDLYPAEDDLGHPPIYAYPNSFEDRRAGRVIDGFWVPGRFIEYVNGRPCIAGEMEEDRHGGRIPTD